MTDMIKLSAKTRELVQNAVVSRAHLIKLAKERYETEPHKDVDTDILARRIAMKLKEIADTELLAKERKPAFHYDNDALVIIGKKTLTKSVIVDDNTRTKDEQAIYHACDVWLLRLKADAGVKSSDARGGKREARTPDTKVAATIVPPSDAPKPTSVPDASFSKPQFHVPKARNALESADIVRALGVAAQKALSEGAKDGFNDTIGSAARDTLVNMVALVAKFEASVAAWEAKQENTPKGARREAVVKAFKAHAPAVEELH